jgi:SAM-dependent methyltransferase
MERRYGIRSRGEVILPEHREDSARLEYKPTPWTTLARALRRCEVGPEDVFVDFGAGKGRVVFLAARYPFRRVVGVELSPELSAVAQANVERNMARLRCRDVQIVTGDVLNFAIPDDLTVAFFFNPFRGDVFASVVERLLASVDRRPRRVRIVYRNPAEHECLMATGRVRLVRRIRGMRPTAAWSRTNSTHIYEVSTAVGPARGSHA